MRMTSPLMLRAAVLVVAALTFPGGAAAAQVGLQRATYFGGEGDEIIEALAVHPLGGAVVVGRVASLDMPVTAGVVQPALAGEDDAFVARFDGAGQLLWSTYLGGVNDDVANAVGLVDDGSFDVIVSGRCGNDFPTTPGAFAGGVGGGFVTRLSADGSGFVWSTVIPGGRVRDLHVAPDGDVVVGGLGTPFLATTTGAFQETFAGGPTDGFVARVASDGGSLDWCTYVGGSGDEAVGTEDDNVFLEIIDAVVLDTDGTVIVSGAADSTDFPVTAGAFQTIYGGSTSDNFVARVFADGSDLHWCTYLGGSDVDFPFDGQVAADGTIVIGGDTASPDYPVTAGAYDTTHNDTPPHVSHGDAFLTRLSADGASLVWSTFLGGGNNDHVHRIVIASDGSVISGGSVESTDFPLTAGAFDQIRSGGEDAWLARMSADGSTLLASTYFGGFNRATIHAMRLDSADRVIWGGPTKASDLPMTPDAWDPTYAAEWDGWLAEFDLTDCPSAKLHFGDGCPGGAGLAPSLEIAGCPSGGQTLWLQLRYLSSTGGTAFLFLGLGTDLVPVKPSCSLAIGPLLPTTISFPVPATTATGASIVLPAQVPASLLGPIDVGLQYLIAEPTAPDGVSGTNAVTLSLQP